MRELQRTIIEEFGVKPQIDPSREVEDRVRFLQDYLHATGTRGFVLGISGGLDSTLAGKLAQLAVDDLRDHGEDVEFIAMRLPYGVQVDEADAQAAMDFINPSTPMTFNIKPATDGITQEYARATGRELGDFNRGNVKARERMVAQYAVAAADRLLVIGTDHAAESVTGFFTKFGDGGADVLPLFGLDKGQNRELLRYLGAPERLWAKAPTADLLDEQPGRTDEDELGLSYDDIDAYLEGQDVPDQVAEAIETRWRASRHKRTTPVTILNDWWRS